VARYDFGFTDEQFGRLTSPQFWALWDRRAVNFKRSCYQHGLTAAAVYNVNRSDDKQHVFTPFDFIGKSADDAERDEILMLFKRIKGELSASQLPEAKQAWTKKLTELGRADVFEIISELFPEE
jgi:hypothetical protein